jgi:hypothetical protein
MASEEDITTVVHGCYIDSGLSQQSVWIRARRTPKWIEYDPQTRLLNYTEIDDLAEAGKIHAARVEGLGLGSVASFALPRCPIGGDNFSFNLAGNLWKRWRAVGS